MAGEYEGYQGRRNRGGGGGAEGQLPLQLWRNFNISPMALHGKNELKSTLTPPTLEHFLRP